eukprot:scaffold285_cov330-Pavlova_lutheri.AAC.136
MGCDQQIAQSIHAYLEVHPLHTLQPAPPCGVKRTTPMHCHNALLLQYGRKMPIMFDWNADIDSFLGAHAHARMHANLRFAMEHNASGSYAARMTKHVGGSCVPFA